jgi:hypothetical protein
LLFSVGSSGKAEVAVLAEAAVFLFFLSPQRVAVVGINKTNGIKNSVQSLFSSAPKDVDNALSSALE